MYTPITSANNLTAAPAVTQGSSSVRQSQSGVPSMEGGEFMMLILAQLRHQDPLKPMDDSQMIAQFTQLNSLEELQKINTNLESLVLLAGLAGQPVEE